MTITIVYVPNNRTSEYKKQKFTGLKGETDNSTITGVKISTLPKKMPDRPDKIYGKTR